MLIHLWYIGSMKNPTKQGLHRTKLTKVLKKIEVHAHTSTVEGHPVNLDGKNTLTASL